MGDVAASPILAMALFCFQAPYEGWEMLSLRMLVTILTECINV